MLNILKIIGVIIFAILVLVICLFVFCASILKNIIYDDKEDKK